MKKIYHLLSVFTEIIEIFAALIVAVCVVIGMAGILPHFPEFIAHQSTAEFSEMLERVLTIVIGTEFIKMLVSPDISAVTEVLIYLIARHMIVSETTPVMDLVSVISISILFILRRFLQVEKDGHASLRRILQRAGLLPKEKKGKVERPTLSAQECADTLERVQESRKTREETAGKRPDPEH